MPSVPESLHIFTQGLFDINRQMLTEHITMEIPEDLKELMDRKEKLESEIMEISSYLTGPGMPGVKGKLVDEQGFPRSDLDIVSIRTARNRLACLNTDHCEVMQRIEKRLHEVHAQGSVRVPRANK